MKKLRKGKIHYIGVFFLFIIIGAVLANLFMPEFDSLMRVLEIHEVSIAELANVSWKELFLHILLMRLIQFGLFCVIVNTWRRFNLFLVCVAVCGLIFGMQTAVETMNFGVSGVLYSVSVWMPQTIFYGVAMYLLYVFFFKIQIHQFRKNDFVMNGMKYVLIFAVLVLGCFVEAFINPSLLYMCAQYIVCLTI